MDRIGIPRGFLYYRYGILWKSFFDVLEIPYIVSDNTTYKTLERGKNIALDEACLAMKIF